MRWAAVALLFLGLGWAIFEAMRSAVVDAEMREAKSLFEGWEARSIPPPVAWNAAWARLRAAERLDSSDPWTQEMSGLVASRRVDDHQILKQAREHYVRALTLRPIAPVTWANLAEVLYLSGDTAKTFEDAIQNAARSGPSHPHTQRMVAHYGLPLIDKVSPRTRGVIESMVGAGMRRDPGEMLLVAQGRGRLDVACRYLPETRRKIDARWQETCAPGTTSIDRQ